MTVMPRIRIHLVLQPVLQPIFQTICRSRSLSMQAHDVPKPKHQIFVQGFFHCQPLSAVSCIHFSVIV